MSPIAGIKSVLTSNLFIDVPIPKTNSELSSQTYIVTGANTGLGYEASLHLSRLGVGTLIMGVRNLAKGTLAKSTILATTGRPEPSIDVWEVDMDNHVSIKAFASRVSSELPRIDGVLANAGIMTSTFSLSAGGVDEKTLSVNVIGTFLLYLLLVPAMRASKAKTGHLCRFVIPNSALHHMAPLGELDHDDKSGRSIFDRLNDPDEAKMSGRYSLSKLLVLYAVRELPARSEAAGKGTSCVLNTPNPSFCKSNLANEAQSSPVFRVFEKVLARSTEEGSRVLVHGLLAGEESNGQYLSNCHIESPASHVTNKFGQKIQRKFVDELFTKLEQIQPEISKNI